MKRKKSKQAPVRSGLLKDLAGVAAILLIHCILAIGIILLTVKTLQVWE